MEPEEIAPRQLGEFADKKKLLRALIAAYGGGSASPDKVAKDQDRPV